MDDLLRASARVLIGPPGRTSPCSSEANQDSVTGSSRALLCPSDNTMSRGQVPASPRSRGRSPPAQRAGVSLVDQGLDVTSNTSGHASILCLSLGALERPLLERLD